ncbi:MAG: hypothetical protein M1402_00735 [Candidatus Thermoplasmatota archaeon]|nr:hypothetical protein [Candidatus Thermoplasmatota archaeon]MCL5665746.1 hypothetical protein [Candidatus Thermoplasmatota archaeon]
MQPIKLDLALYGEQKGTLYLYSDRLSFKGRKGLSFDVPLNEMKKIAFHKTAFVTSTLFINDMEITVCRAHLWCQKIRELRGENI